MSLSSFRPFIPQPLQQCLTMGEQAFYRKHHDRVRQNHVIVYYLMLFVFACFGCIFLYGSWTIFTESNRIAASSSSRLRSIAYMFFLLAVLFFGVFGYYIRELTIKKQIERLMKKCSR